MSTELPLGVPGLGGSYRSRTPLRPYCEVVFVLKLASFVLASAAIGWFEARQMRSILAGPPVKIPAPLVVLSPLLFLVYLAVPVTIAVMVLEDPRWAAISAPIVIAPVFAAIFLDAMPRWVRLWYRPDSESNTCP